MSVKQLLRSFAGGEIAPELLGRIDLGKFQTGLALARNFIVLPHGPVTRRPGTEFINEAKDSTKAVRLIPFTFSATQTAVLEFGHQYIRFHIGGATLVETGLPITAITKANPGVVTYSGADPSAFANGDWMYLSGIGGMTELNGRWVKVASLNTGANTFALTDLWGNNINTTNFTTFTSGGTAARAYTLTTTYDEADLFDLTFAQDADIVTICHPSYEAKELRRLSATSWTLTAVSFTPALSPPTNVQATIEHEGGTGGITYTYCVTAVEDDGVTESLASTPDTAAANNLSSESNYNEVTWDDVDGAAYYFVYKQRGGAFGYMGKVTDDGSATFTARDDNIVADTTQTPPEETLTLNDGANAYPSAIAYHEQRRFFAGTNTEPQAIWATRTGALSNLTSSLPTRDADAFLFRVSALQYNQIRHLVPLSDLIALTAAGEFRIYSEGAPSITPTSISIKPQGYAGASKVQPIVTPGSVLYVQAQGSRVRELAYADANSGSAYKSTDVSLLAPHRFDGYTLKQLAYTRAPDSIAWAVRSDGVLLGMTYVPDQQVFAWHAHDTDGYFESCCVVAEDNEDVLYVVVRRTVNARTVRYIERLHSRFFTDPEDAYNVDCGLIYDGSAVDNVTGLWHLEGAEVDIVADGSAEDTQEVANGTLPADLDQTASVIHVGLPYTSDLTTLPLTLESAQAMGQGMVKNVNKVTLRVNQSSVIQAGPNFTRLRTHPTRAVTDLYGNAAALTTGEVEIPVDPDWVQDAVICVRQDAPMPLTVLSMTIEVQVGG